jgi:hypothetical protein
MPPYLIGLDNLLRRIRDMYSHMLTCQEMQRTPEELDYDTVKVKYDVLARTAIPALISGDKRTSGFLKGCKRLPRYESQKRANSLAANPFHHSSIPYVTF